MKNEDIIEQVARPENCLTPKIRNRMKREAFFVLLLLIFYISKLEFFVFVGMRVRFWIIPLSAWVAIYDADC